MHRKLSFKTVQKLKFYKTYDQYEPLNTYMILPPPSFGLKDSDVIFELRCATKQIFPERHQYLESLDANRTSKRNDITDRYINGSSWKPFRTIIKWTAPKRHAK